MTLTATRLREVLSYDPGTGAFTWKVGRRGRAKLGTSAGTSSRDGYVKVKVDHRLYPAHRLAWLYVHGEWPAADIDHIDGVPANNAFANLRLATPSQNLANSRKRITNSVGFKGVSRARNRYRATITVGYRWRLLGHFDTPEEAHEAYCQAARAAFGEFANSGHLLTQQGTDPRSGEAQSALASRATVRKALGLAP